jgi:hypothetical protein
MRAPAPPNEGKFLEQRRPQVPEALLPNTVQWMASLPATSRPKQLAVLFTRIANELARRWDHETRCADYLDDLLVDRRGTRSGFPVPVALEIAELKNLFESVLHPRAQTAWDDIAWRRLA